MATQTRTQRQAAAKKAAATRKRRSASQSNGTPAKTAARRLSAERVYLDAIARRGERAVLIPVGAALEARDRIVDVWHTYGNRQRLRTQLNRFERRGETALRRNRRAVERQARDVRDDVVERVRSLA